MLRRRFAEGSSLKLGRTRGAVYGLACYLGLEEMQMQRMSKGSIFIQTRGSREQTATLQVSFDIYPGEAVMIDLLRRNSSD